MILKQQPYYIFFYLKNVFQLVLILFFLNVHFSTSQNLTQDIGIHIGTSIIHTDYGEGNKSDVNRLSVSFSHTLYFFDKTYRNKNITNHLAIRSEINFVAIATFKHIGSYVSRDDELAIQLRAMTGSIKLTNIGFQGEIYLKDLENFIYSNDNSKWNPYVKTGIQFTLFKNTLNSSLGDWTEDSSILPEKWRGSSDTSVGRGNAFSSTLGFGTRYKISNKMDLNAQLDWQFLFSDALDGLQSNSAENKDNDCISKFQLGIIYHL